MRTDAQNTNGEATCVSSIWIAALQEMSLGRIMYFHMTSVLKLG